VRHGAGRGPSDQRRAVWVRLTAPCELIDRAIDINPCNATSLFWGSWADVISGNAERALERAQTSLQLNPMSGIRHLIGIPLGIALFELGHHEQAAEQLRAVVAAAPQPDALAALTVALVHSGNLDEARAVYARLKSVGGAIGGLAVLRNPAHAKLVEEALAIAAEAGDDGASVPVQSNSTQSVEGKRPS